ncbi:MAG TPA: diaminopimelate epimerase [Fimbriiglobus sp.]|jgi:diaminopimelate epimerase
MRFTKMHGIGNDYVYVDCVRTPPPKHPEKLAVAISDRHRGVGSDGLILICRSEIADARMRMFNADGSESEMCGNGLRCVAKFIYDYGIAKLPQLAIETGRGVLTVDLEIQQEKVHRVRVNMGTPILESARIPTTMRGDPPVNARLTVPGLPDEFEVTAVSMGNPHIVIFVPDVAAVPLETVGPILEGAPQFPNKVNVHFVRRHSPKEVTMRTWERGSGITLACGTGACSVCVAGFLTKRTGPKILAHLPGGDLELEWAGAGEPVYMTGPATEVFSGDWPDELASRAGMS